MSQVSDFAHVTVETRALPVPFVCRWQPRGSGSARVYICGELDLATLPVFRQVLSDARRHADTVSIDLQELTFVDCSGLTALYEANGSARKSGTSLVVIRGSGQVDRVMAVTGLLDQLQIEPDPKNLMPAA